MTVAEAQDKLSELGAEERAEVLEWLWEGLQSRSTIEIQGRWAKESEERLDAVEQGDLPTKDGPSVLREMRRSLES